MASQPLRDLPKPKETSDAVTKKYVDDLIADNVGDSPFFKENGNFQATHAINMAFKKLLNLSTPSEPYEAATKEYVDQKPHIIAIHADYRGPLRKGKYQFIWGESGHRSGVLSPHSCRIKQVAFDCAEYLSDDTPIRRRRITPLTNVGSVFRVSKYNQRLLVTQDLINVSCGGEGFCCDDVHDDVLENATFSMYERIYIRSLKDIISPEGYELQFLASILIELDPL